MRLVFLAQSVQTICPQLGHSSIFPIVISLLQFLHLLIIILPLKVLFFKKEQVIRKKAKKVAIKTINSFKKCKIGLFFLGIYGIILLL